MSYIFICQERARWTVLFLKSKKKYTKQNNVSKQEKADQVFKYYLLYSFADNSALLMKRSPTGCKPAALTEHTPPFFLNKGSQVRSVDMQPHKTIPRTNPARSALQSSGASTHSVSLRLLHLLLCCCPRRAAHPLHLFCTLLPALLCLFRSKKKKKSLPK